MNTEALFRPKLQLLSEKLVIQIISEAYELLENPGIFVENSEALELFKQRGMQVDTDQQRVRLTGSLVDECLAATPSAFSIYDRSGEQEYYIGGDEVHFDPGSAAVTILDHKTRKQRKAVTSDLIRFSSLTDRLQHIALQSTGLISSDVPQAISDSYRLYICLLFCTKPVVTGTFRVESFLPMKQMLAAVRGGDQELADKPLAIFDACPSPPLKWSHLTSQSLIDSARAGIPSELISMGMTGATSPITIAGTLVQHVAENLCGLVICQLACKGAPVIFGGSPSSFDMRKGTTPMGAVETMMIDAAYAQIAKHLNLPTHAYMALSDAKINDSQAGLETGIGAALAALAGINVISGPGMLDFESCQSLEKLVIDDEICGMALRLIQGIAQRDDPLATHLFKDFRQETQFLSSPHTRKWYRQEHIFPHIIDRDNYDAWTNQGSRAMDDRAALRVQKLLEEQPPAPIDGNLRSALDRVMIQEAEACGLKQLPGL